MWFSRLSVKSLISSFPICWDQCIISKVVLLSICSQVGHRQIGLRIFQRDLQVAQGQNSGSYVILKCNTSSVCSLNPTTLKSYAAMWQKSPNLLKRQAAWCIVKCSVFFTVCSVMCTYVFWHQLTVYKKIIPVPRHWHTELFVLLPIRH